MAENGNGKSENFRRWVEVGAIILGLVVALFVFKENVGTRITVLEVTKADKTDVIEIKTSIKNIENFIKKLEDREFKEKEK